MTLRCPLGVVAERETMIRKACSTARVCMDGRQATDPRPPSDVLEGADLALAATRFSVVEQDRVHDRVHEAAP